MVLLLICPHLPHLPPSLCKQLSSPPLSGCQTSYNSCLMSCSLMVSLLFLQGIRLIITFSPSLDNQFLPNLLLPKQSFPSCKKPVLSAIPLLLWPLHYTWSGSRMEDGDPAAITACSTWPLFLTVIQYTTLPTSLSQVSGSTIFF